MIPVTLVLKSLHHCLVRRIEQTTKKYGLTGVQFLILQYLLENRDKDVYQKDIEKFINVRRSTATGILQNLTHKGFIKRVENLNDARLKKIVLSEKVEVIIKDFDKEMERIQQQVEKDITKEEKEIFLNVANKIQRNLEN